MNGTQQLIAWFIAPAPIILLWFFLTNKDMPIKDKFESLLLGELFGPVSAVFIILFWIMMFIDKISEK